MSSFPSTADLLPSFPLVALLLVLSALVYTFQHRHGNAVGTSHRPDLWEPKGARFLLGHLPVALKNKGRFLERTFSPFLLLESWS
jgi:hypothetical protein